MPKLVLTKAITLRDAESGIQFRRGIPLTLDEDTYHRLLHSGKVHDPDKDFQSIDPIRVLPTLKPGTDVIIAREMGLGDVLMVTIVARALARKFPKLRFTLATSTKYISVLGELPFLAGGVRPLIEMDGRYPYVVELRGLSEKHVLRLTTDRIDIFALYCGIKLDDYSIPIAPPGDLPPGLFRDKQSRRRTVAVAVRGSTGLRTWPLPNVHRFIEMGRDRGWTMIPIDGSRIEMPEGCLNLTGQLDLPGVKALLKGVDFVVSPDTGILHLAEAVGTRCLALFTMVPPELRITHYKWVKGFARRDLACFPCHHRGCAAYTCGAGITPESVIDGIENFEDLPLITNPHAEHVSAAAQ